MKNRLLFCLILCLKLLVNGENEVTSPVKDKTSLVDICLLEVDNGTCNENITRYYYSKFAKTCHLFNYTGCGGNLNNFGDHKQCVNSCPGKFISFRQPVYCFEEVDKGMCEEQKPRFYYNWKTGKCEKFVYGGCYGNNNKFASIEECNYECRNYEFTIQI